MAHLYNLRRSNTYRNIARRFTKTKLTVSRIGELAKPDPKGQPGYIRIDTVHQGDLNNHKGVYHIDAVDEITQWEIVTSVERISGVYLALVLESMLVQFPFVIRGFHSDNGSEFVNHIVAGFLVETKNGSVVRKQLGYAYIPQRCAELTGEFDRDFFNPYINFHRPCFFPVMTIDPKARSGKLIPTRR